MNAIILNETSSIGAEIARDDIAWREISRPSAAVRARARGQQPTVKAIHTLRCTAQEMET